MHITVVFFIFHGRVKVEYVSRDLTGHRANPVAKQHDKISLEPLNKEGSGDAT